MCGWEGWRTARSRIPPSTYNVYKTCCFLTSGSIPIALWLVSLIDGVWNVIIHADHMDWNGRYGHCEVQVCWIGVVDGWGGWHDTIWYDGFVCLWGSMALYIRIEICLNARHEISHGSTVYIPRCTYYAMSLEVLRPRDEGDLVFHERGSPLRRVVKGRVCPWQVLARLNTTCHSKQSDLESCGSSGGNMMGYGGMWWIARWVNWLFLVDGRRLRLAERCTRHV
jgi:hypothetical protein